MNTGDLMIQLSDNSAPTVLAQIREIEVAQVRVGQEASITVGEFSNGVFSGRVTEISSVSNTPAPNIQTVAGEPLYEVAISSEELQSTNPLQGMAVLVTITVDQRRDVLVVPVKVLNGKGEKPEVEVVKGGVVARVSVTPGLRNGHLVQIKEGLQEGDVVLVNRADSWILGQ